MLANAVIAGVEKAGTTSLFRALSEHRDVAPASVKETRYFQPLLYGQALEPLSEYEAYFTGAGDERIRIEATPRYFYGGATVAHAIRDALGAPRILIVLREPVARLVSFFESQKARLRIPADLSAADYLACSDELTDADFRHPTNHAWFGVRGGRYADWLPAWHETFGPDLQILFFEELIDEPAASLGAVAGFLGIDPDGYATLELADENRTTAYKRAGFQRVALGVNDRLERFLRRHYKLKERMRALYYRLNGAAASREALPSEVRDELRRRYAEPNARLVRQLDEMGVAAPQWTRESVPRP
jgi:Sulfotransferase domain